MKNRERRADDVMTSIAVLVALEGTQELLFNGIPVSDSVRQQAIDKELYNLIKILGISDKKLTDYLQGLDWSEGSPEQREFNHVMETAVLQVVNNSQVNSDE